MFGKRAKEWYGEPLPYAIEERIATELYGDIVLTAVKNAKINFGTKNEKDLKNITLKEVYSKIHST